MKGRTRITWNRETLAELLQAHLDASLLTPHDIVEWTMHRNGSVEIVAKPRQDAPALPLEPESEPQP